MHPTIRRLIRFMQIRIFLFLNILIDLGFSIAFYKIESEEKGIKIANLLKSLMTGFLNSLDMLKDICGDESCCNSCQCCSKKKDYEIGYETINIELEERTEDLLLIKKIKLKLRDETKKDSQDYNDALSKYKEMEKLENEINEIIIN